MNVIALCRASRSLLILLPLFCWVGCGPEHNGDQSSRRDARISEFQIKEAVFKDLFDLQDAHLHPVLPNISAYVVDDPINGRQIAAAFANHFPPVKNALVITNEAGETLDKVTAKPVEVYSVRIREISCDHARVGAGWHSAPLVGVWYSYELVREKGVWSVTGKTVVGVS